VLEDLGEVVLNDDQNLIISSQDAEAMLHAAQSLQAFWRTRAPSVAVEHFVGDQRLALLSHINQGIAKLGLEQAMQKPLPPYLPKQIAIVTHAEQLPTSDVQMLEDLTRHLPGLCWRWVLLRMETPHDQRSVADSSIAPTQPNSQRTAEPAPAAPAAPLEPSAPSAPSAPFAPGEKVEPFLEPVEPLASAEAVTPAQAVVPAETGALAQTPTVSATHQIPTLNPEAETPPSAGKPSHRWAWLGLAALVGLGAWGAWLRFGVPQPAPTGAAERAATSASTSAASSPASAMAPASAPEVIAASSPETPPLPSAAASQPIDAAAASTPPSQATAAVPATASAQPSARTAASSPADPSTEVPDVALRGVRWLAQQSPEFYVLEHGSFKTAAQAQSLIKTRTELANARVLMLKTAAAGGRFLVITGPFRSQERAQNYKVRENLPPQIPVRQVSDVLKESVRAAPSRP
jgi:hypothetical protein